MVIESAVAVVRGRGSGTADAIFQGAGFKQTVPRNGRCRNSHIIHVVQELGKGKAVGSLSRTLVVEVVRGSGPENGGCAFQSVGGTM